MLSPLVFAHLPRKVATKCLSVLIVLSLLLNTIVLPLPLRAQSTPNADDGQQQSPETQPSAVTKTTVYLPLIQSNTTTSTSLPSDQITNTTDTQDHGSTQINEAPALFLPLVQQQSAAPSDSVTVYSEPSVVHAASNPTPPPSGARPPYPFNHVMDANPQLVGTPPLNYDFETPGAAVGTPPANHDFSAAPYDVGTPPTNYNFATGDFSGWSTAGTVNIQSDATHGSFGRLQSNGVLISDAFTVDAASQQVAFEVGYLTTTNYSWFELYILTGPGYATETKIAEDNCSSCGYWVTYGANVSAYIGQSVKLKFKQRFGSVGIDDVRTRVLLPNYTFPGKVTRLQEANGNVYVRLGADASVTTAAFTVDNNTQLATVDMRGVTTAGDQYRIEVLSGPTFATVLQVAVNTNAPDTWQNVPINLGAWQGQSIKLRITGLYGAVGADNIALQQNIAPYWQVTGTPSLLTENNGNRYLSTNGTLTSAAFTLAPDLQQITLRHRGSSTSNSFLVKLLRGPDFSQEIDLTTGSVGSATGSWQTYKVALNLYAGETVKLKLLRNSGRIEFDDVAIGENVLPGWRVNTHKAIATGEDSFGSYVTSYDGGAFIIRSSEITAGIYDPNGSVQTRQYAIAYNIGQATGSLLRVYWVDAQENDLQLMQVASNTPTGYRVLYFPIYDFLAQPGRLVINVTNGGRVYSIADNIARQHLSEPYALDTGAAVDTSTGSFALARQDLVMNGSLPLTFTRYYNSHVDLLGTLGYGWSHSYSARLFINGDGDGAVILDNGQELAFRWLSTPQTFTPVDPRATTTLVKNGSGAYLFTSANGDQYLFASDGRLNSISRGAAQAAMSYDGTGRLTAVTASSGGSLTLTYEATGRLSGITASNGQSVTYSYDGNNDLASANRTNGGLESYGYNRHRLSQVSADGSTVVQNSYDDYHRVMQHSGPAAQPFTPQYSTPTIGVTAINGADGVTSYYFDNFQRTTYVLYPNGSSITYVYNAIGNLIDTIYEGFNQPPSVSLTASPVSGQAPLTVTFSAAATDPNNDPLTYQWNFGDGSTGGNSAVIEHLYTSAGHYTATLTVSDTVAAVTVQVPITVNLPNLLPPVIDPTEPTSLSGSVEFLYTGDHPVQTGVLSGTIDAQRVAVVRGRVLGPNGQPLPGVQVTVLNHPELGHTQSRTDGNFDLAVNGGGLLTFNFTHSNYLPVQRQSEVAWQDYTLLDDVVMTALDPVVTMIDLTAATPVQVARSSVITDSDGMRQSTLLIPQGVQATMVLPDGSTQPLTTLHIRSTEYTVGDRGPAAMPGALPPQSGYTYAVELSVDEALAVGARDVHFTQPLYHYVENFLNFPVGIAVPNGYYDRVQAAWVPAKDGRVIQILTINNGLAEIDTDGDGVADNDAVLGITTAEQQQLATLYTNGQSLWRVPIEHFTPWDHNWPFGPPPGATPPGRTPPGKDEKIENPCEASGSIIECETQVVGQRVDLVGTPYTLNYRSDRTLGRPAYLDIPVTDATLPDGLIGVELEVRVAGQRFSTTFDPQPNQRYEFVWNRKDGYGRTIQGTRQATVRLGYTYQGEYDTPSDFGNGANFSFGNEGGVAITGSMSREQVTIWREYKAMLGSWDARGLGVGGWSMDVHHVYDPVERLLYQGDGQRRMAERTDQVILRAAGTGAQGYNGDGPALSTSLTDPSALAVGPDGSLYFAEAARIRRLYPNGMITTIAGTGTPGYNGDNIPATQAQIKNPGGIAFAPDGTIYISDTGNNRIRRIDANGIIRTVAGDGVAGYAGDGFPATQARFRELRGIAFGPDGSLYIADASNHRVRRMMPNGLITTAAGNGIDGFSGDGGRARSARLSRPFDVAVAPDGTLYIADLGNHRIRWVTPSGLMLTVAGNGNFPFNDDGIPATSASVGQPFAVELGLNGELYILHGGWNFALDATEPVRIRQLLPNGILMTIAGGTANTAYVNNVLAATAALPNATALALAPDNTIYLNDRSHNDIRRISPPLPGFTGTNLAVPSADGTELYQFTHEGRHLRTLNALTGATLYTFAYTVNGFLQSITDGSNNVTTIERAPDGKPTAIVSPYGQRTVLALDSNGYLNQISNPAGEVIHLQYTPLGLLTRMSDPRNEAFASTYVYDSRGRLERNTNAAGGYQIFTRTTNPTGYTITKQNALGHVTEYAVTNLPTGEQRRQVTAPNGGIVTTETKVDGTTITTDTRGVVTTMVMGADPRWAMQAPYVRRITSRTPDGETFFTLMATRTVTLSVPGNPLTVQNQTDIVSINGRTTTTFYIGPPRLLITTKPSGETTTTALDTLGRPVQVNRANFAPVVYNYDNRGRLERIQEGEEDEARITVMTYDAQGYLDTVTNPMLGVTSYNYDAAGRVTEQQLPSLHWLYFDYDDAGNLIKQTNAQGIQADLVYDVHNRLQAQVVDPGGRAVRTEFFYDLADNLTRSVADVGSGRLNLTTHYTYTPCSANGEYLQQQVIDPEGNATHFTYTPAGDLRTKTDALGHTTTYTYTAQGWLYQMLTPGGRVATTLYTNDGQPDLVTDPRGSVTDFVYDALGRVEQIIAGTAVVDGSPALNQITTYVYDVNDRVRMVTDAYNQSYTLSYDAFGQLNAETNSSFNQITYQYDKLGRLLEQVVGADNPGQAVTTRYSYDAVGRRTTMRLDPDGLNLTTVYSYTQPGSSDTWNLQQVRDPKGNVTKSSYNSLGLQAATTDALNQTWSFTYDNLGHLTRQTDPLGRFVDYIVDGLGRTTELHQDGRVEAWSFRPDGALATYIDFAGRVTTFGYDGDQLLTAVDYPEGMADVAYDYDAGGNVIYMSDGLGATSYSYDVLNRLDTRMRNDRAVNYDYNATNQVTNIDYWGQGNVAYHYFDGRMEYATLWGGAANLYYYYNSIGTLGGVSRPNGVATTYSYDTAGRLAGLNHTHSGTTLNNIVYGLDANGNRDWMTDNDGLTDYVYDALNRLDAVTYPAIPGGPPAATIDYSMDDVGNRTGDGTTTYNHDASDRITNAGFVYDANGNLLSDGVKSYEYDAANRLTKVISGSVTIDYAYDGWGNLILESSNGITTEYVLDESSALPRVLGEVRSDGTERLYAYGPEGFAAQMTLSTGSGQAGGIEYPLTDGLGSVRHLTDSNGNVILSRSYDAYGNILSSSGSGVTGLGFTGEVQNQTTGLVYLRARFYHPVLGRFLQRDSFAGFMARAQSLNRYSYTENNPATLTDPSGHCPMCIAGAVGAGIGGLLEYGGQVYQNYQDGLSGGDMFRPRDWGQIGRAAIAGGIGGLTGFALGPWLAGLTRFAGPMAGSIVGGALEGAAAGALGQIALNLMRGCAWDRGLMGAAFTGGLGGAAGAALGRIMQAAMRKLGPMLGEKLDDLAQKAGKLIGCDNSFSADTPVMTTEGKIPISEVEVGDLVLAYNEETGETGYYTVTAVMVHIDPAIVHLTIDGETIETTPEHPFYVMDSAPWLATGASQGRWVEAGDLHVGDAVRQADGTTGLVQAVVVVQRSQPMYNLTVAVVHTFFVGQQQWLVHNQTPKCVPGKGVDHEVKSPKPVKPADAIDEWKKFLGQEPYSNTHPRTGVPDPDRIVSADGTRSIRYGDHEMNSLPNRHHYHEETWVYDPIRNVMDVFNTLVRVPLK